MLMKELIGTCSHEPVAEAAVVSIGPVFYARVANVAGRHGLSVGAFSAQAVRDFRACAAIKHWQELSHLCAGHDMPILRGLHHIVEAALEADDGEPADWLSSRGVAAGSMHHGERCAWI